MPNRFKAGHPGFLDGLVYLYAVGYLILGTSWLILRTPAQATQIAWFSGAMTNENLAFWFIIAGSIIIVLRLLFPGRLSLTVSLSVAIFVSLFPGLIFSLAWIAGLYTRGIIPGVLLLFLSTVLWWSAYSAYKTVKRERDELEIELLRKE